jgi:hypothetical protein
MYGQLSNISYVCRDYCDSTLNAYMTWYNASTRCKLTRAPPERPRNITHEEQLVRGIDRTTADRRDFTVHILLIYPCIIINNDYYNNLYSNLDN